MPREESKSGKIVVIICTDSTNFNKAYSYAAISHYPDIQIHGVETSYNKWSISATMSREILTKVIANANKYQPRCLLETLLTRAKKQNNITYFKK